MSDITYIPDLEFHKSIDEMLEAEGIGEHDPQREERDTYHTETRLGIEKVWPKSWETLHADNGQEERIQMIVLERRARRR